MGDEAWVLRSDRDGAITLSSVRPGTFVVSVVPGSLSRRYLSPAELSVEVRGGGAAVVLVPIPVRRIRFARFGEVGQVDE